MNYQVRAAIDIAKMMALAAAVALAVVFIFQNVPGQILFWVFGVSAFGYLVYVFWYIRVSQLRYEDKLRETKSNR